MKELFINYRSSTVLKPASSAERQRVDIVLQKSSSLEVGLFTHFFRTVPYYCIIDTKPNNVYVKTKNMYAMQMIQKGLNQRKIQTAVRVTSTEYFTCCPRCGKSTTTTPRLRLRLIFNEPIKTLTKGFV